GGGHAGAGDGGEPRGARRHAAGLRADALARRDRDRPRRRRQCAEKPGARARPSRPRAGRAAAIPAAGRRRDRHHRHDHRRLAGRARRVVVVRLRRARAGRDHADLVMSTAFIERHGLWSEEQHRRADEIRRRIEADKLRYVRLAWGDTHGYARAKTLTIPAFLSALSSGHNIGVATATLDSAGARVFASFTRGGGMGIEQMTGSPNITAVPDPMTFRVLPWAPGTGWIL